MTWQSMPKTTKYFLLCQLRLQSCSRILCRVHFLYGSSLDVHQPSPPLTVTVSTNIMMRCKMRLYLLAFLQWKFVKEKGKYMDVPSEQRVIFPSPIIFIHSSSSSSCCCSSTQSCSYRLPHEKLLLLWQKLPPPSWLSTKSNLLVSKPLRHLF